MKSGLAVGEGQVATGQFSREELRDLFVFREDTGCETHELLQCQCGGSGELQKAEEELVEKPRACQLGGSKEQGGAKSGAGKRLEELAGWRHWTAPVGEQVTDE